MECHRCGGHACANDAHYNSLDSYTQAHPFHGDLQHGHDPYMDGLYSRARVWLSTPKDDKLVQEAREYQRECMNVIRQRINLSLKIVETRGDLDPRPYHGHVYDLETLYHHIQSLHVHSLRDALGMVYLFEPEFVFKLCRQRFLLPKEPSLPILPAMPSDFSERVAKFWRKNGQEAPAPAPASRFIQDVDAGCGLQGLAPKGRDSAQGRSPPHDPPEKDAAWHLMYSN